MNDTLLRITRCEVCNTDTLEPVLDLGRHPMCDDLVPVGDPRVCREYPIQIGFCPRCITAHQMFQIPKSELFPATYHYRSRHTADVLNGMKSLVAACEAEFGDLSGKKVLDVGCNDGSLLNFFRDRGAKTFGIEPTGAALDAIERAHTVMNEFFSPDVAEAFVKEFGSPDVITFTNVFAHIEDLKAVLAALRILMGPSSAIVIENHYLGAILDKNQFDTFYHEHPRTYSYASFRKIAEDLGVRLRKVEFPARYGGNIRVFMAKSGGRAEPARHREVTEFEAGFGARLKAMSKQIERWRVNKHRRIETELKAHGPLVAKAFPGRAVIPVKMLGLDSSAIKITLEKPGSAKIGHYIPGTHIPIRSDNEFSAIAMGSAPLVNFAWHISDEITCYMRGRGFRGEIIDIIAKDDFDAD